MRKSIEKKKKNTFCLDCDKDPETCGKNPLDCMKEGGLYFRHYDSIDAKWHGVVKGA